MDNNAFFRFVWRFNGIVIMLLLLGALVCGGVRLASHHGHFSWKMHDVRLIHLGRDHPKSAVYSLTPLDYGYSAQGKAERLYALNRSSTAAPDRAFAIPGAPTSVNILAVDDKTKASRWLFEHGDRAILSRTLLYAYPAESPAKNAEVPAPLAETVGVAMLVAESDTNQDGKVDGKDSTALYFYRLDGKAPVKVLDADRIVLMPFVFGAPRFDLFYQKDGKSFAASYTLPQFKLESQIAVSGMPKLRNAGDADVFASGYIGEM